MTNLMDGVARHSNVKSYSNLDNKEITTSKQEISTFYQSEDCEPDVGQPPALFDDFPCADEWFCGRTQSGVRTSTKSMGN